MNHLLPQLPSAGRALLLTFIVAVPLLCSTAAVEGFEDVKAPALALAALGLGALLLLGSSTADFRPGALVRRPLLVGVLLFLLSAVVSTLGSLSPLVSWRGAFDSHAGLITVLSYAVLYFAARRFGGRRLLACVLIPAVAA